MQAIRPSREEMADTRDQLLVSGGESAQVHWPSPVIPIIKSSGHDSDHFHTHIHDQENHHKKSVLAKVKEKAKKWRSLLTKKKHAEGNSTPTTPSTLEDDDAERDPEYHGAPMYESEKAPQMYKDRASKLQAAAVSPITPTSVLNHSAHSPHSPPAPAHELLQAIGVPIIGVSAIAAPAPALQPEPSLQHAEQSLIPQPKAEERNGTKTLTETVTEILAPAYNMVAAKMQSPTAGDETGAKMMWDKGVSVTEYLLHKLEPGEEVKALSEVITDAISPRKAGAGELEDRGVVEKVKGAVSALLGKEDQQTSPTQHHTTSRPLFKSLEESCQHGSSSIPLYKYTPAGTISGDAHGALIAEFKHKYMNQAVFPQDAQHSDMIPASEYSQDSPPLPVSTHPLLLPSSEHQIISNIPTSSIGE